MVTARVCGKCHTVDKFAAERKTKAEWDEIINKMADEEGLEITEAGVRHRDRLSGQISG